MEKNNQSERTNASQRKSAAFDKMQAASWNNLVFEAFSKGIKISRLNKKLGAVLDPVSFYGKLQQLEMIRIIYDPKVHSEPLIQLTEKGKQAAIDLLFSPETEVTKRPLSNP